MLPLLYILVGALLIPGIINRTRAVCAGRKGYRFFQPLFNVGVLVRKGSVYSTTSTFISRGGPSLYLATILTAAAFIPLGNYPALVGFNGDFVLFAYLMALGRFALIFTALDSGSSFQGMGSAREALFAMLVEPCLFLLVGTLALVTGLYSFSSIFATFDNTSANIIVLSLVVGYAMFNIALVENGRLPVDDPRTHLELTMIHEVMVLDVSGVDLAFVQIASWLKLAVYCLLTANALIPAVGPDLQMIGWFAVALVGFGLLIGLAESFTARNRMPKNATYLATIAAVSMLSFVVAYILVQNVM